VTCSRRLPNSGTRILSMAEGGQAISKQRRPSLLRYLVRDARLAKTKCRLLLQARTASKARIRDFVFSDKANLDEEPCGLVAFALKG